jgi:hypothetical protein
MLFSYFVSDKESKLGRAHVPGKLFLSNFIFTGKVETYLSCKFSGLEKASGLTHKYKLKL